MSPLDTLAGRLPDGAVRLEEALAAGHLTVGHYPQSIALSTVGGWIAAASAGQAAGHLAGDAVRAVDVGTVTCAGAAPRCFVHIAQAGLGGEVVARSAGLSRLLGAARYAAAFWLTLPGFRPAAVRLDAGGHAYAWRAFNVVVANCRFYGGGMQIAPNSDPGDGLLDVLVMTGPKSGSCTTLPKVYRGAHLPHRHIAEPRAGRLRVEAGAPFPVEADGELLGTTPASFGIIPAGLRLKV